MADIESLQNPKIKAAIKLRDKRSRDKMQQFIIEGYREIHRAAGSNVKMHTLFYCPELFLKENEPKLLEKLKENGVHLLQCTKDVFQKLSYRDRPDGLVAIAPHFKHQISDLRCPEDRPPFFVLAQKIEKPGNLGTILRSADAAGVDGIIVCDRCTDIFNPNVVRASIGTLFTQKVIETTTEEAMKFFHEHEIQIVAATPHAEKEFTQADFRGPLAIAVGAEQYGLTNEWLQKATIQVSIPMYGVADSLNVATATTLLLYEVLRQRSFY